jgi:hypothetical protein
MASDASSGSGGAVATGGGSGTGGGRDAAGGTGGFPSPRRPFLVGSALRSAESVERSDWLDDVREPATEIDATTRAALRDVWLKDALEEHASVAAFARLTLLLLAFGAPARLVRDSQRASLDEIAHGKICFGLAARYGGEPLGPSALPLDQAFENADLEQLARLVAEEGCVGETLGAVVAREQLGVAEDARVVRALRRICRDETRHAAFSWRLAVWLSRAGGPPIRDLILHTAEEALVRTAMPERVLRGINLAAWHAHGRLTCREAQTAVQRATEDLLRPSLDELRRVTRLAGIDTSTVNA